MKNEFRISRRRFTTSAMALTAGMALPLRARAAEPFRVGVLTSVTGAGGTYGPGMLDAIRLAVNEINAAGGAGGRQIQLFSEDDQTRADAAVLACKKLVDIHKVQAVLGIWSSAVQLATLPITNAAGVMSFNTCGAPEIRSQDSRDLVWQYYASNAIIGRAFAETARSRGFKRPAVLAYNNSTMLAQAETFRRTWEASGDKVAAFVVYEPNQTSYRTELSKVLAAKPDIISLSSYTGDATIILRDWYQTGQDCKFIAPGYSANQALAKALGPEVTEGIIALSNVPASSGAAYKQFVASFKKASGHEPEMFAACAYDMAVVLGLAMEAAGPNADVMAVNGKVRTVTNSPGTKVSTFVEGRDVLRRKQKIDFEGASSGLEFDANGDTVPDFGVYVFEKGTPVLKGVTPGKA